MVTRGADPAQALEANRSIDLLTVTPCPPLSCDTAPDPTGNVEDLALSADGRWVAVVTEASLVEADTDEGGVDVYVIDAGGSTGIRWITDADHPDGDSFWFLTDEDEVDISADGRWVTWTMGDQGIPGFFPPAVEPAGTFDTDTDADVFVAAVDVDASDGTSDGDLTTGAHGGYYIASVDSALANLGGDAREPTVSDDGRYIAFTLDGAAVTEGTPSDVRLHDRDPLGDGYDGSDGETEIVPAGEISPGVPYPVAENPSIGVDAAGQVFVAFRVAGLPEGGTSRIRWWRRGEAESVDITSSAFTGGVLAGTDASWPSISADGAKVAYEFEYNDDNIESDIPFGRQQAIVVEVDPGNGAQVMTDPDGPDGPETPTYGYIASQDAADTDPATRIGDSTSDTTPVLSNDGRYVAFESNADNFAGVIGSGDGHIYAVDLLQLDPTDRVPVLVSANDFGEAGDDGSLRPAISATGEYIAFSSRAENLDVFFPATAYDGTENAFRMSWVVDAEGQAVVFPNTAVGATSASLRLRFDTDDFGPWTASAMDFLDGYVDPEEHDFEFIGTCVGGIWHANDPCEVDVVFAPIQVGDRVAEACVQVVQSFSSCALATVGGRADMPDGLGPIVRESLTDADEQIVGGEGASAPAISADGRYVAFVTPAQLDDVNDNDFNPDVYVRDRLRGTTTLISSGPDTANPDGPFFFGSREPSISGDGQFIAFTSDENNVLEGEGDGGADDIYRVDRGPADANGDFTGAPTQQIVSPEAGGGVSFDDARDPSISGDGTQIAFTVAGGEGSSDVIIRDLTAPGGPLNVVPTFAPALEVSDTFSPAMSADGDHVALVADTRIGTTCCTTAFPIRTEVVYIYDRDTDLDGIRDELGASGSVQVSSTEFTPVLGAQGDTRFVPLQSTDSLTPAISGDGSTVAYSFRQFYDDHLDDEEQPQPVGDWLTPLPFDGAQVVVIDRDAAGQPLAAEIVSVAGPGDPDKSDFLNIAENAGQCLRGGLGCSSHSPDLSDDGRYVAFLTDADNFPIEPLHSLPGTSFCGGEGTTGCDVVAVDRDAPANAGGPQHVNEPLFDVFDRDLDDDGFNDLFANRDVGKPTISADGRLIAFDTGAEYLLGYQDVEVEPEVFETRPIDDNDARDVYLREWQPVVDNATPLAFPDTPLGLTSAPQTATFGTQDFGPAPVLAVEILGANPGDFLVNSALNCLPPLPFAPAAPVPPVPVHGRMHLGDPCSVSVAFRPTAVGVRGAILRVTTGHPFSVPDAPAGAVAAAAVQVTEIPLTGGGAGQGGFSSQPAVDFGSQIVTVTSPEIAIPVTNSGNTPFQITNIALDGANPGDFAIVGTDCIGFLAPGATCTVRVTFTPTAPGDRSATLVFTDTAPGGPHLVGLTGTAPAPTLVLNPGVIVPGRTVQILGANWAPNQVVTITSVDANDLTQRLPGTTQITANAFGIINGSLLFFPKTITGPRLVVATGTTNTLVAFQPLLVQVATINGIDFVNRG